MIGNVAQWHEHLNEATVAAEPNRVRQFGLRPIHHEADDRAHSSAPRLPGEVWAWQPFGGRFPAPDESGDHPPLVRVGFAGRRMHLGHLGLARTAAQLAGSEGIVLTFDASVGPESIMDDFRAALGHYGTNTGMRAVSVRDDPAQRSLQHRALASLKIEKLRRLYGWDSATSGSVMADLSIMLGFFLHTPDELNGMGPGTALVDSQQAAHSAVLARTARAVGCAPPVLLYRRLFPDLRRLSGRSTTRDPDSTLFIDDPGPTIRRKVLRAHTGGRPTAAEQRVTGGDPTRCAVFATIELLTPAAYAESALQACTTGSLTCTECKNTHVRVIETNLHAVRSQNLRAAPARAVPAAVLRAAETLHKPPPRDAAALESAVAFRCGVGQTHVVVGNGSTEVLDWIFRIQARSGATVVLTDPTFELYGELAGRHGLIRRNVRWDRAALNHDVSGIVDAIDADTRLCVLDLPHSISGACADPNQVVDTVVRALPADALLVLDLVYADYMDQPPPLSGILARHPNALLLGSLSKADCLLGARIGYALAPVPLAARLREMRLPYSIGSLALAAADATLADDTARQRTIAASRQARARLTAVLDELGVRYGDTGGNFLLMDLGGSVDAVIERLRRAKQKCRDGRRWGMPGWLQVHLIDAVQIEPIIGAVRGGGTIGPRRPGDRLGHSVPAVGRQSH